MSSPLFELARRYSPSLWQGVRIDPEIVDIETVVGRCCGL
jgi:hypothetical protein